MRKTAFCFLLACIMAGGYARAQGSDTAGIPEDVFYLMPSFGEGSVYFSDKSPAHGRLNICAVDNSLRFIDDSGQELSVSDIGNVRHVIIDGVMFIRNNGAFYRVYPLAPDLGIALRRAVRIKYDGKPGAYGSVEYTSSITEYGTIYGSDGTTYNLNKDKKYPYVVSEILFFYRGNSVEAFNKKNLRKSFPGKKDEIDLYFKSGKAPKTAEEALELLEGWNE